MCGVVACTVGDGPDVDRVEDGARCAGVDVCGVDVTGIDTLVVEADLVATGNGTVVADLDSEPTSPIRDTTATDAITTNGQRRRPPRGGRRGCRGGGGWAPPSGSQ